MAATSKICRTCKQEKPLDEFHVDRDKLDGHKSQCKECNKKARKEFYEQHPGYAMIETRRKKYKLGQEEYLKMVENQQGRCFICKEEKKLHVDHNHATQKVRALICQDCNLMLGHASDDPLILVAAIEYLEFFDDSVDNRDISE